MKLKNMEQKIVRFIQKIVGEQNVVIGLSGGVDSAVVATLCVKAIGKKRVTALLMPERGVTRKNDVHDAQMFAQQLGIKAEIHTINGLVDALRKKMSLSNKVSANAKARARMMYLYAFANTHGALVAGTGNKSELLVGYFTKYGDGAVDFLPIGDLYKTEVWKLAAYLGVPQSIIDKEPSAGLWKGQTDEEELSISYEKLDAVLQKKKKGLSKEEIKMVSMMITKSAHKRVMAPICKQ
jgi:NAD+ synthase